MKCFNSMLGILTVACIVLGMQPAAGFQHNGKKTMLEEIPVEVRDYLTAGDGLAQAAVVEKYPNVQRTLRTPATRAAILRYLASDEPWKDPTPGFTINALAFLQGSASAKEAPTIHGLLRHPNPWVRLRAYEYMMGVYYPASDRAAMITLFEEMIMDTDEINRVQSARWIKGVNAAPEMSGFLQGWIKTAVKRKWDHQESFEIVQGLLK
jgi:hypothetical protein